MKILQPRQSGPRESGHMRIKWLVEKYQGNFRGYDEIREKGVVPYEKVVFFENLLLNEGIDLIWTLVCGGAGTPFDNANARIGVGDGGLTSLTGTLTFTNGSATVTGSSTAFSTEIAAGDEIQLDADGVLYRVKSVESDTSLTLENLYAETGGSGAGSKTSPTETGLAGTNKAFKAMDSGYPTYGSSQKAVFRSTFGGTEANFTWNEFTVVNGADDTATNLNRKVQNLGTKASGTTWTLTVEIILQ